MSVKPNLMEGRLSYLRKSIFALFVQLQTLLYIRAIKNLESLNLTLQQAQEVVDQWIKDNGVRYFSELTNMAVLMEEVGEVARIISRKYGEQSFKKSDEKVDLADEFADVLFVLICLANQTGVDLSKAFQKNIEKKTKRDSERHKNNPKLQDNNKT